jgi:crossover junction endodeoxyribonuclease RuvC
MTPILGIDPGLDGALALYTPSSATPLLIMDMPTFSKLVGTHTRRQLNLTSLKTWLEFYVPAHTHVYLESPTGGMPRQSSVSTFSFGKICGATEMAIVMMGLTLTLVSPQQWKKAMGLTADKDHARYRAGQLFPHNTHDWALKSQDGRAEAVLLAYYGSTR